MCVYTHTVGHATYKYTHMKEYAQHLSLIWEPQKHVETTHLQKVQSSDMTQPSSIPGLTF